MNEAESASGEFLILSKSKDIIFYNGVSGKKSFGLQLKTLASLFMWLRLYLDEYLRLSILPIKPRETSILNANSA